MNLDDDFGKDEEEPLKEDTDGSNDTGKVDGFVFQNYFWFYDARANQDEPGDPEWKHYEDHKSVMLERRYYEWIQSGKNEELC